ncbi:hypothetical protein JJJ17_11735 [Paracoccus caeni]|uniref:Cytochrome C oxidase assembly protein n=1 Tax=Paracoccus caeni TaxID=657651 RepID=A0A934W1A2_9RHOB|nr:hypothetical protein [Paracoccus caeni]MBK4216599.1 hypothetical protein [Paracoccus caeni]
MALKTEHELHGRRRSRNVGLAVVLALFVALVFGLTVVKVQQGDMMEAFDHQPRTSLLPVEEPAPAPATGEASQ